MNTSIYYNLDKILSYNAMINFIIGERGTGKSFSSKEFIIRDFIKNGNQFIYLRRYKTELKSSVQTFFNDIILAGKFEDHELKVKNNKFYIDGQLAGEPIALSTSNILKSSSYPNVRNIIFDEFIIDPSTFNKYLNNEVVQFLDVVETIGRMRDNLRILMLGNAISISNPYFLYFKLDLPYGSDIKTFKEGTIAVQYIKNEKYREAKKQSRFGKLISGSSYGEYAINNEFLRDSNTFVQKKQGTVRFLFAFRINGRVLGVWSNQDKDAWISNDYDPNGQVMLAVTTDDHDSGSTYIERNSPYIQYIMNHYRDAKLYFENQEVKNLAMNLINKTLSR